MIDDENPQVPATDLTSLTEHLARLGREIEARPDAELLKAAHLSLASGDQALDEGELRRAAQEYTTAAFLVQAAGKKLAGGG
jgi:hypothetical protein